MKSILSFVVGFVLAAVLFVSGSLYAQSAPADYLKKAEAHVVNMARFSGVEAGAGAEKRLEAYQAAQKFFGETKPVKGFAAFHAQGLFAAVYCVRSAQASIDAKKAGDADNIFAAGILLEVSNSCLFASQDAVTLWFEAKGD